MTHEMIEEGKLSKKGRSVLHPSRLTTTKDHSEMQPDNTMSSASQLQGDTKRQKKHEPEASEKQKNIQAAAEFWATMRQTHGFQNQDEGLKVQDAAVTEVTIESLGLLQSNKYRPT
jgi:hypothetical protein